MKTDNHNIVGLLGILSCCMAKKEASAFSEYTISNEFEIDREVEQFKLFLSTLKEEECDAILDELQRFIWLDKIA